MGSQGAHFEVQLRFLFEHALCAGAARSEVDGLAAVLARLLQLRGGSLERVLAAAVQRLLLRRHMTTRELLPA